MRLEFGLHRTVLKDKARRDYTRGSVGDSAAQSALAGVCFKFLSSASLALDPVTAMGLAFHCVPRCLPSLLFPAPSDAQVLPL